jgi:tetratricopeptide (TPR) repeat protein
MGLFGKQHPQNHNVDWNQRSQDAERYWDRWIASKLSKDQKILLAENLFRHVFRTQGKEVALSQIIMPKQQAQMALVRFDRGCQLWGEEQNQPALLELRKSQAIQDAYPSSSSENDDIESQVKLHYASGTVHMAMKNYPLALKEFCQAWRMSGLRLGINHVLTLSSQHAVGNVLSRDMGLGIMEAQRQLNEIRRSILYEKEGDFLHSLGDLEMALQEYKECFDPKDNTNLLAQAHVKCKIGTILQEEGQYLQAGNEWAMALTMYQSTLGSEHPLTIQTMKRFIDNHNYGVHPHPGDKEV